MDYLKSGGQTEDENLKRFISLGSAMTNAEFLVCNDSGYALLTADQRLGGKVVAIPQEITQEVLTGSGLYQGRSSLGGAYTSKQFVVGVPVQDGDQTIGMVLAVMNARSVMGMWRSFISLFLMTSAIILLLVFIVTSLTSMRQIQPIREMVHGGRSGTQRRGASHQPRGATHNGGREVGVYPHDHPRIQLKKHRQEKTQNTTASGQEGGGGPSVPVWISTFKKNVSKP